MRALALVAMIVLLPASASCVDDVDLTGDVRLRLKHVDSARADSIWGTYGELLARGFSFTHRLVLEASYTAPENLRFGGTVRVSNEAPEVLSRGPDYLSSEFGSAFLAYETPSFTSRLGYYSINFSPLTLMRWDLRDDPEGSGGGCACGVPSVAGAILGETVEELGPQLTFEGMRLTASPRGALSLGAFWAKPGTVGDFSRLMAYGGRAAFTRYSTRAGSFFEAGAVAVRSEEDRASALGQADATPPFANSVYAFSWKAPLARWAAVDGEWTLTRSSGESRGDGPSKGKGGIVSLSLGPLRKIKLETSYIYLSPHWDSFFRALSYSGDRQGLRVRAEASRGAYAFAVYAKYLRTVDPLPSEPGRRGVFPVLSARAYATIAPDLDAGLIAIYSCEGSEASTMDFDIGASTLSVVGTLTYEFAEGSSISLEERYVKSESETIRKRNYDVSTVSLYVRAAIW